ncbi:hypothetical protein KAR91_65345 [Candidatus Pacearchaeota archaeon]|nr:hypothetical protein [Candidatus Pacearchaeota archaeon]
MGFFDDDGFDNMVREMFNGRTNRRPASNAVKMPKNQVVTKKKIYLIFDISGSSKIDVEIKDEEVINDYNEKVHTGKKAIVVSDGGKVVESYGISKEIKPRGFEWVFNNGILEIIFKK